MTAGPQENQLAAQAVAAAEAAEVKHLADALAQHRIVGSTVAIEDARTPDDVAVSWTGSDNHPGPGPSPQPTRAPNVAGPLDDSQSQPG
jgi:hypothetical protein